MGIIRRYNTQVLMNHDAWVPFEGARNRSQPSKDVPSLRTLVRSRSSHHDYITLFTWTIWLVVAQLCWSIWELSIYLSIWTWLMACHMHVDADHTHVYRCDNAMHGSPLCDEHDAQVKALSQQSTCLMHGWFRFKRSLQDNEVQHDLHMQLGRSTSGNLSS
jgi:hypothetical protein